MKLLREWLFEFGLGAKDIHVVRVYLNLVENKIKSPK